MTRHNRIVKVNKTHLRTSFTRYMNASIRSQKAANIGIKLREMTVAKQSEEN